MAGEPLAVRSPEMQSTGTIFFDPFLTSTEIFGLIHHSFMSTTSSMRELTFLEKRASSIADEGQIGYSIMFNHNIDNGTCDPRNFSTYLLSRTDKSRYVPGLRNSLQCFGKGSGLDSILVTHFDSKLSSLRIMWDLASSLLS